MNPQPPVTSAFIQPTLLLLADSSLRERTSVVRDPGRPHRLFDPVNCEDADIEEDREPEFDSAPAQKHHVSDDLDTHNNHLPSRERHERCHTERRQSITAC